MVNTNTSKFACFFLLSRLQAPHVVRSRCIVDLFLCRAYTARQQDIVYLINDNIQGFKFMALDVYGKLCKKFLKTCSAVTISLGSQFQ